MTPATAALAILLEQSHPATGARRLDLPKTSPKNHLCPECRERRARFRYRGRVRADRSHTLCFECFRRLHDRLRATARKWHPIGS